LDKNLSNFFIGLLENLRNHKDILKLTDLYTISPIPNSDIQEKTNFLLFSDLFEDNFDNKKEKT
jgi:hypothetical protein